jgi:hypothetical protein
MLDAGGAGVVAAETSPEAADYQSPGQRPISAKISLEPVASTGVNCE